MHYVKVILGVLLGVVVFLFLDYTLPSKNTVQIIETYNRRTPITTVNQIFYAGEDTGTIQNAAGERDVRFINTVRPNGKVFVYRNEDTGWVWPPYFKYDSANLHAEATNLRSTKDNPVWVSVTAYGWRMPWLSAFPNAVSVKVVSGPQDNPRNWAASLICVLILAFLALLWRMWAQFRERTVDPAMRRMDERAADRRGRLNRGIDRLLGRR